MMKIKKPVLFTLLSLLLMGFGILSFMTFINRDIKSSNQSIETQIKRILPGLNSLHLNQIRITSYGPYSMMKIAYDEPKERTVTAKAHQFLWFAPVVTCASEDKKHPCW